MFRRKILAGAALALLASAQGCSTGLTATGAATSETRVASEIPQGFLLGEPYARKTPTISPDEPEESWVRLNDKLSGPLEVGACGTERDAEGRTAMRTIVYTTSAPEYGSEQLALYRSKEAASEVMARLRECVKSVNPAGRALEGIGDEAIWVAGERDLAVSYDMKVGAVAARRGSALFVYTSSDESVLDGPDDLPVPARKMAEKVCTLQGVCD
ncbi:hypothetical protein [Streptosporangium sp. NPDC000396]|uniref:hypothetical protein n=1 Tax=Streptosporangium sp. NPDC000396 TaxID=3366185 RepID=UPI0036AF5C66